MVVLNTDIQTEERFEFDPEKIALKVCEEVLKQESFPEDAEISLVVTDAEVTWPSSWMNTAARPVS